MANRGRCVIVGHAQRGAIVKTRKRSMASRVEERELAMSESGASPTMLDLARLLRITNADESMLRLSEVKSFWCIGYQYQLKRFPQTALIEVLW
ncbi:unnamed protein product [Sphacelaria rigidula]